MGKKKQYRVAGPGIYGADGRELSIGEVFELETVPDNLRTRLVEREMANSEKPDADTFFIKDGEGKNAGKTFLVNKHGKHLRELTADEVKSVEALQGDEQAARLAELAKG